MNKTIYMTYKKPVPDIVFSRWINYNPTYKIDFSLDEDCIHFLEKNFNRYIVNLFKTIPIGMYKADLWRLCNLYINGGVYADVDLVPYLNIDTSLDKNISFYSCLSVCNNSIFQAFMVTSKPKNPLILQFIISFLMNNPYNRANGPTYDMYNCLAYNLNIKNILPDVKYNINEIKIKIKIGSSKRDKKYINLFYFPDNIPHTFKLLANPNKDSFTFTIKNNILIVKRIDIDTNGGWGYDHSVDICIESKESVYFFKENTGKDNNSINSCFVTLNNEKILDSRDLDYYNNKGW